MSMTQLCLKIADSILIKHFIFSLGKRSNTVAYFSNGFFSQPPTSYLFILGNFSLPNPPVGHPKRAVSLVRESLPETTENTVLRPGALDQTSMASGSERIRWCVDGQKLDSHAEKLISPEFRLGANFGGALAESQPFRIMLLATQTGGKHGAGFKKAKGRGNIEIKCLGSYEGPSISLLVTVGSGSRKQKARELVKHNFAEKSCCPLAKGGRDPFVWDLKAALSKETKCVEVCIEVLPE